MNHYVYHIEDKETKEFYFGVRSCKKKISEDNYMGSMTSWKPNKKNLTKQVIGVFHRRNIANKVEREIISLWIKDPLNRNYHIPGKGFCTYGIHKTEAQKKQHSETMKGNKCNLGTVWSEESRLKAGLSHKGIPIWNKGLTGIYTEEQLKKISENRKNIPVSEETRRKLSEASKRSWAKRKLKKQ